VFGGTPGILLGRFSVTSGTPGIEGAGLVKRGMAVTVLGRFRAKWYAGKVFG